MPIAMAPEEKLPVVKEYNKGGFVTKEFVDYLKYDWDHP
jgi:hypothetical protein